MARVALAAGLLLVSCSGEPYRVRLEGQDIKAEIFHGPDRIGGVGPVSGVIEWTQGKGIVVTPTVPVVGPE